MKHLSDDDITKGLETLGQSFQPSITQKEKLHRQIFQSNRNKKTYRIQRWIPIIVSFIVLFSIGTGTFFLINDEESTGAMDVTASWEGVRITQTSQTSLTNYEFIFNKESLVIEDRFQSLEYNPDLSDANKEKALKRYKITETPLVAGEYTKYRIEKNDDIYTIKVTGKEGFTYTLQKVAPRKFVGEEGIEYSTGTYIE